MFKNTRSLCQPKEPLPTHSGLPGGLLGTWCSVPSVVSDSVTPWTVACQTPPSMGFSRQEHWSGLSLPPPGDLPDPGIEPASSALQAGSLSMSHQGRATEACGDQDNHPVTVSLGRRVSLDWGGGWQLSVCLTHTCVHPHTSAFSASFFSLMKPWCGNSLAFPRGGISEGDALQTQSHR